jgi:hypothetical protein
MPAAAWLMTAQLAGAESAGPVLTSAKPMAATVIIRTDRIASSLCHPYRAMTLAGECALIHSERGMLAARLRPPDCPHESFEMDAERIRSLLIEAANTIFNLRRGNGTFPNPRHREKIVNFPKSSSR